MPLLFDLCSTHTHTVTRHHNKCLPEVCDVGNLRVKKINAVHPSQRLTMLSQKNTVQSSSVTRMISNYTIIFAAGGGRWYYKRFTFDSTNEKNKRRAKGNNAFSAVTQKQKCIPAVIIVMYGYIIHKNGEWRGSILYVFPRGLWKCGKFQRRCAILDGKISS